MTHFPLPTLTIVDDCSWDDFTGPASYQPTAAWDCDPSLVIDAFLLDDTSDLDEEDASGDWQVIALDRFGDRLITPSFCSRGDATISRCW